jgi:signal transduction histidine kinase
VIVKRCIDLHGGTIRIESRADHGTMVTVRLPKLKSPVAAAAAA